MVGVIGKIADAAGRLAAVRWKNECPSPRQEDIHICNKNSRSTQGAQASAAHQLEAARLQRQALKRQQDPIIGTRRTSQQN